MFELTLENIKNRIRVDVDFDDAEIEYLLLPAAKMEIKGAVTKEEAFYTSSPEVESLFNLAVINVIGHHYENRSTTTQFEKVSIPQSSLSLIQTLRGAHAVWKSEDLNTESEFIQSNL